MRLVCQEHLHSRIVEDVAQLRQRVAVVQRDDHRAHAGNREVGLQVSMAIDHQRCDAIARLYTEAL
jgi:hypothetical protein